jgi:hypothetical protein
MENENYQINGISTGSNEAFQQFDQPVRQSKTNPNSNYMLTGNQIPINIPVLIDYVIEKLKKYDSLLEVGQVMQESPYNSPIVYTLEDTRKIEIPQEIQKNAIAKYLEYKDMHIDQNKRHEENITIINNSNYNSTKQHYSKSQNKNQHNIQNKIILPEHNNYYVPQHKQLTPVPFLPNYRLQDDTNGENESNHLGLAILIILAVCAIYYCKNKNML